MSVNSMCCYHQNHPGVNIDDNNLLTAKLQKKFQARALSLENALEKINTFMDEEHHLYISGITKENTTLRVK